MTLFDPSEMISGMLGRDITIIAIYSCSNLQTHANDQLLINLLFQFQ